jgi:elongator complex protein 3
MYTMARFIKPTLLPKGMNSAYLQELVQICMQKSLDKNAISRLKARLCEKYKVKEMPTDIEVLMLLNKRDMQLMKPYLQTKPVRSLSGVAVCAIMTRPRQCPHGKCIYCPGGPQSFFGDVPQSYTGHEPATRRAIRNSFDPYLQVFNRLEQYIVSGHLPEKLEVIVMGGTFPSYPVKYQREFVAYAFKAMNDFSERFFHGNEILLDEFKEFFELPGRVDDKTRELLIRKKVLALKKSAQLEHEQLRNERAKIRCVGLTIETRPDYAALKQANLMLALGCTRVELGVQSLDDGILKRIKRGHSVQQTIEATRTLKDLGFKINYHIMLGLPGSTEPSDLATFKRLFSDAEFRPDMLKIYPCMVLKGTKLYNLYKKRAYKPLRTSKAAMMISAMKSAVPEYVRIMRVQRDIPTVVAEAGVDRTNLRQYVAQIMRRDGLVCRCIRCREAGRTKASGRAKLKVMQYDASEGNEYFISIEDNRVLFGFCRLRFPSQSLRKEITQRCAIVRELHVYGESAPIGKKGIIQHRGYGKELLKKAEQIARQNDKRKMVVISGIGAREYYKKLGYDIQGPYMVKEI